MFILTLPTLRATGTRVCPSAFVMASLALLRAAADLRKGASRVSIAQQSEGGRVKTFAGLAGQNDRHFEPPYRSRPKRLKEIA
jgi:hypothetical protein